MILNCHLAIRVLDCKGHWSEPRNPLSNGCLSCLLIHVCKCGRNYLEACQLLRTISTKSIVCSSIGFWTKDNQSMKSRWFCSCSLGSKINKNDPSQPPIACRQRWGAAGPEGCLPYPESLPSHCRWCRWPGSWKMVPGFSSWAGGKSVLVSQDIVYNNIWAFASCSSSSYI